MEDLDACCGEPGFLITGVCEKRQQRSWDGGRGKVHPPTYPLPIPPLRTRSIEVAGEGRLSRRKATHLSQHILPQGRISPVTRNNQQAESAGGGEVCGAGRRALWPDILLCEATPRLHTEYANLLKKIERPQGRRGGRGPTEYRQSQPALKIQLGWGRGLC